MKSWVLKTGVVSLCSLLMLTTAASAAEPMIVQGKWAVYVIANGSNYNGDFQPYVEGDGVMYSDPNDMVDDPDDYKQHLLYFDKITTIFSGFSANIINQEALDQINAIAAKEKDEHDNYWMAFFLTLPGSDNRLVIDQCLAIEAQFHRAQPEVDYVCMGIPVDIGEYSSAFTGMGPPEGDYFINDTSAFPMLSFEEGQLNTNAITIYSEWWTSKKADEKEKEEIASDRQIAGCSSAMLEICKKDEDDPLCLAQCKTGEEDAPDEKP